MVRILQSLAKFYRKVKYLLIEEVPLKNHKITQQIWDDRCNNKYDWLIDKTHNNNYSSKLIKLLLWILQQKCDIKTFLKYIINSSWSIVSRNKEAKMLIYGRFFLKGIINAFWWIVSRHKETFYKMLIYDK